MGTTYKSIEEIYCSFVQTLKGKQNQTVETGYLGVHRLEISFPLDFDDKVRKDES